MESEILAKLNRLEEKIDYLTQKIKESTDLYRQIQIFDEEQLRAFREEIEVLKQSLQ